MSQLEKLFYYDSLGIVPTKDESERAYLKRAIGRVAARDDFVAYLKTMGYSPEDCDNASPLREPAPEAGYGFMLAVEKEKKFFAHLPFWLPAVAAAEYLLFCGFGMGVPLGLLANRVGVHAYRYVINSRALAQYERERHAIAAVPLDQLLETQFPSHGSYISDRLDHDEKVRLSSCHDGQELLASMQQMSGVKWAIIRERLRQNGHLIEDSASSLLMRKSISCLSGTVKGLLATLLSSALFFETTFGYRDLVTARRQLGPAVSREVTGLQQTLYRANNLGNGHLPVIKMGHRALHYALSSEAQAAVEANLPVLALPGLRHATLVYTYLGSGLMGLCDRYRGMYSPEQKQVTFLPYYRGSGLISEERYVLFHELGHHYVDMINPKLADRHFSKQALEQSLFHEGLAEYLAITALRQRQNVFGRIHQHRLFCMADIAQYLASGDDWSLLMSKSHHYSLGYIFVDYVVTEIGAQHLSHVIAAPPTFQDIVYPERYVLALKRLLGQEPILQHQWKLPRYSIDNYVSSG
ncbi:hypothetical protein HY639_05800 [Candidatus Woesearchaeota archaeon]|nr:hypothetical protein [Candidatus Woesearchaeota archaeon]